MPRKKTQPVECLECGASPTVGWGLCARCYQRLVTGPRKRGEQPDPRYVPKRKVPEVEALYSYPDPHPGAPGGQRLVRYKCPHCKGLHMVSWLPFDEHPGTKEGTCRKKSATGTAPLPMVFVLAPPEDRQYDVEPSEVEAGGAVARIPLNDGGSEVEVA